jgi:hypothetical protein
MNRLWISLSGDSRYVEIQVSARSVHLLLLCGGIQSLQPRRLQDAGPWLRPAVYFRLAAVRSTESLAMNDAPHQLDPAPLGLIALTLPIPVAV